MPTINQLVKKNRTKKDKKKKSPVLNIGFNSKEVNCCEGNKMSKMWRGVSG